MGDTPEPNGVSTGCRVFGFQVDVSQIAGQEADEPDAVVHLLYSKPLSGEHA